MRKVLLLVISCFCATLCSNAVEIGTDKLELNGDRYIQTTSDRIGWSSKTFSQGKGYAWLSWLIKNNDEWTLVMKITHCDEEVSQGRLCLIKLNNGDVIELALKRDAIIKEELGENGWYKSLVVQYNITKEQMLKFNQIGVEKIRVETNLGYCELKPSNFEGFIKDAYRVISDQCKIKNDIYYNF